MLAFLPEKELDIILSQQSYYRYTPTTATSKEELAIELVKIRNRGYALDNESHEAGIICVAHPIVTESGRLLGALSVTSNAARTSIAQLEKLVPELKSSSKQIAEAEAYWRFPDNSTITRA